MLGSIISAGANLVGGLFGSKSQDKANKENIKYQKQYAQNQVQWRAADARKAGISPLVALGMSPMNFAPSSVGDTSLSTGLSAAGQDIGRAVAATASGQERMDSQVKALTLTRMDLENTLLASQIAKINQPGTPPPISARHVIPGQGDVPILEVTPPTRTPHLVGPSGKVTSAGPGMDAQVAETRYGDIAQEVYGIANWIADNFPNAVRTLNSPASSYIPDRYKRRGRDTRRQTRGGGSASRY